ncbi:rodlin [Streptomyces sp. NPDC047028]|uniref:rodlin n=1 Tax=Streptomyces sp. NPDC047028 TaxID=3155793 RepID=UPI00340C2544
MIKKVLASAAVAACVVGVSAAAATPALALGNDGGTATMNEGAIKDVMGNSATYGNMSPQLALIQGSFNKPCIGLPAKLNAQSILALVNVGVQDIPIMSSPQNQQCTENSTQAKGDDSLAHVLEDVSALSTGAVTEPAPAE